MSCLSRISVFRFGYYERGARVVLASVKDTQRTYSFKSDRRQPRFETYSKPDYVGRAAPYMENFRSQVYDNKDLEIFGGINLYHYIDGIPHTEGAIINTIQRISMIMEGHGKNTNFQKQFSHFLNSTSFFKFCKVIESKVAQFSAPSLLVLYDLDKFNIPPTSPLMKKVLNLVLDKFSYCFTIDKLNIYIKTKQKSFGDVEEYHKILQTCEEYMEKKLAIDLYDEPFNYELLKFLDCEVLPKKAISCLANKLVGDVMSFKIHRRLVLHVIGKVIEVDPKILSKEKWLKFLEVSFLYLSTSAILTNKLCLLYFNLVKEDKSYFSIDFVEYLIENASNVVADQYLITIGVKLCKIGYLESSLVEKTVAYLLSHTSDAMSKYRMFSIAEFLSRVSFHETHTHLNVLGVLKALETVYKPEFKSFDEMCVWCLYLTYIGCDMRDVLDKIFENTNREQTLLYNTAVKVLLVHHLAKVKHSDGYTVLKDEVLDNLINIKLAQNGDLKVTNLNEYFESEDYILKNCVSSQKHILDFVAFFDENNKPIMVKDLKKKGEDYVREVDTVVKPPGSKMIAFQRFTDSQPIEFLNKPIMSGVAKMFRQTFEGLDCSIVLLPNDFTELSPENKKNYLETEIKKILEKSES